MSVLEEFQSLEQRVVSRLRELRPLAEEYEQLRQVADRFGFETEPAKPSRRRRQKPAAAKRRAKPAGSAPRSSRPAARRRPGSPPGVGTKAVGAERRANVLKLIEQRPGITVPDISRELGVDAPPLYRTVRKLQSEGVVRKEGKSLTLA